MSIILCVGDISQFVFNSLPGDRIAKNKAASTIKMVEMGARENGKWGQEKSF